MDILIIIQKNYRVTLRLKERDLPNVIPTTLERVTLETGERNRWTVIRRISKVTSQTKKRDLAILQL